MSSVLSDAVDAELRRGDGRIQAGVLEGVEDLIASAGKKLASLAFWTLSQSCRV